MPVRKIFRTLSRFLFVPPTILTVALGSLYIVSAKDNDSRLLSINSTVASQQQALKAKEQELQALKNQDQYKRNEALQKEITAIETTYKNTVKTYEMIEDLKVKKQKIDTFEKEFIATLGLLSQRNYASAEAKLAALDKQLAEAVKKLEEQNKPKTTAPANTGSAKVAADAPVNNTPPGSGFSVQKVKSDAGEYTVSIVAADLNSTRVIVDTASDGDCRDNCPVMSLSDYVGRNGAFAGINGSYFCPASYPSCAGKTNSFDTLLMNKNKTYFNSDNNVYSNVPVAVFGSGWARFIGASSGWGRDTSVDAVIANQPLMVSGGNVVFGGDGDPKKGSVGSRSFIGNKGSTVYIGVVHGATVAGAAHVLKAMGLENALNLDSGGSTALWHGGYKAGPGRNIPNAILFVRK